MEKDLNDGLRTRGAIVLGGGNPAHIPAMQDYFDATDRYGKRQSR